MRVVRGSVRRSARCCLMAHADSAAAGSMSCVEAAEVALRILHQLVQMQAAVDADGNPLQPLPIVHRTLASPQCLPHIAQVGLLALDPPPFCKRRILRAL